MTEFDPFKGPGHTGQAPKAKATPTDVAIERIDALADTPLTSTGKPPSPESVRKAKEIAAALHNPGEPLPAGLVTAASLLDPDHDPDEGDFEPGLYKGFAILPRDQWPRDKWTGRHEACWGEKRFYVQSGEGTPGLVPWPGSQIVWPWEAAWEQDLYRETVTSFLKEEKPKKASR